MDNQAQGSTTGFLTLIQIAQGGAAGEKGAPGAGGGSAGAATSTLFVNDTQASRLKVVSAAFGGHGASYLGRDYPAPGAATAVADVTSKPDASDVDVGASASGQDPNATANVQAGGHFGDALATASGAGKAKATASLSNATSGFAKAQSSTISSSASPSGYGYVATQSYAPVDGIGRTAKAIAGATIDGGPLDSYPASPGQTVALADFHLGQSGANSVANDLGSVEFSAGFGGVTQPAPLDYRAQASFEFSTTAPEDFAVSFSSVNADVGSGVASLVFKYDVNGVWTELDFSTLGDAAKYFVDNQTLDLGHVGAGEQLIAFTFDMTANGDPPGFSMAFDALATPTTSSVPEPSTWAMMLAGFVGLGFASARSARAARHRTAPSGAPSC